MRIDATTLRRGSLSLLVVLCAGLLLTGCRRQPKGTPGLPLGALDVRVFGARGDGRRDDTAAFQRALKQAGGFGGVVVVSPGRYRLTAPLEIAGAALMGVRPGGFPADEETLPVLEVDHALGPVIRAGAAATVEGLMIRFPHRADDELSRPPAIELSGIGITLNGLKIEAAWDGIVADGLSNIGRLSMRDIFLSNCFNHGVFITHTLDVAHLDHVEVWSPDPRARKGASIGFRFGKNDQMQAVNLFAFGMTLGFMFEAEEVEPGKFESTYGDFANCATDQCTRGIKIEGPARLSFSGGTFLNHLESVLADHPEAMLRFSGAEFKSNGGVAVHLRKAGRAIFSGSIFRRFYGAQDRPRIVAGEVGSLVVSGCVFDPTGPGIKFEPGVVRAVVSGTIFEATEFPAFLEHEAHPGQLLLDGNIFSD